nr:hypothetical protein [Massilia oculi]
MASLPQYQTLKRGAAIALLALACAACATPGRQLDPLDRGVVAIHTGDGNFVSWRALGPEDPATAFNLYRDGVRINTTPLGATNFVDTGAAASAAYSIRAVSGGRRAPSMRAPAPPGRGRSRPSPCANRQVASPRTAKPIPMASTMVPPPTSMATASTNCWSSGSRPTPATMPIAAIRVRP